MMEQPTIPGPPSLDTDVLLAREMANASLASSKCELDPRCQEIMPVASRDDGARPEEEAQYDDDAPSTTTEQQFDTVNPKPNASSTDSTTSAATATNGDDNDEAGEAHQKQPRRRSTVDSPYNAHQTYLQRRRMEAAAASLSQSSYRLRKHPNYYNSSIHSSLPGEFWEEDGSGGGGSGRCSWNLTDWDGMEFGDDHGGGGGGEEEADALTNTAINANDTTIRCNNTISKELSKSTRSRGSDHSTSSKGSKHSKSRQSSLQWGLKEAHNMELSIRDLLRYSSFGDDSSDDDDDSGCGNGGEGTVRGGDTMDEAWGRRDEGQQEGGGGAIKEGKEGENTEDRLDVGLGFFATRRSTM